MTTRDLVNYTKLITNLIFAFGFGLIWFCCCCESKTTAEMDTFAIRSNRVHSTCSGGDEDSEEKEAIRMEKELIRLDKEEIRFEKESIMLERESIRLEREAISLEKEAIRLEKEAIRSEKEAIRSEKEAVQEGLYEVEDVRRKRVSKVTITISFHFV